MYNIFTNYFVTKLGTITSSLTSNLKQEIVLTETENSVIIRTIGHQIEIITFKVPHNRDIDDSQGWIWRIKKENSQPENLKIDCILTPISTKITTSPESGEYLDSIAFTNNNYILHIGTEDSEALYYRAYQENDMPKRFISTISNDPYCFALMKYLKWGFETATLELKYEEVIYLHFIIAIKSLIEADDINTWLVVDQNKLELEQKLSLTYTF